MGARQHRRRPLNTPTNQHETTASLLILRLLRVPSRWLLLFSPTTSAAPGTPTASAVEPPRADALTTSIGFASSANIKAPYAVGSHAADSYVGFDIRGFIFEVQMPCGTVVRLGPGTTVPRTDVPCPCGNPNHWLWKTHP